MDIEIRTLHEHELPAADRLFRLAFGTFLGLPEPLQFMGDADLVATRWRADPTAAFGAFADGLLLGSNFVAHWGSFGFFGPLTVDPACWDQGIARRLLASSLARFDEWGTRDVGLFTFAHSAKHVALYQKFGFWPQRLTAVMSLPVAPTAARPAWSGYAALGPAARERCIAACRELSGSISPGLDLAREIRAVADQGLGDTVLVETGGGLAAFAICHFGAGTEAGGGTAFVKFGAARDAEHFERLIEACIAAAAAHGLDRLVAGVNTARLPAYRQLLARGFRTELQGVAMQRGNAPGHNRPDCYVIDDWR